MVKSSYLIYLAMGHVKPGRKKKIVLVEKSRKKTRERVVHKCVLYLGM